MTAIPEGRETPTRVTAPTSAASRHRVALALVVTAAASVTVLATHKRPAQVQTVPVPVPLPLRASRSDHRLPLLPVRAVMSFGAQGATPRSSRRGPSRPAGAAAHLSDVTEYCRTGARNAAGRWPALGDVAVLDRSIPFGTRVRIDGNVYTVRDWVGSGADWDIFGGSDAGCEQRALTFGRRRLHVVEVGRRG